MKAMKKALALGLALAMVVTAVPVTSAQAASTAKLSASKVSVAAGTAKKQTKSIKVTTPSTWKSVKVKASSSDKKIATVKVSGKTVKVTAVKKGSAKVTVKVSAKKRGKTVKKTLTAKVTVINAGLRFVDPATEVVVGESVALTAKKSPKAAVVTFKSSDDTIATVDADGKVTAVKAGKVTITATSDYGKVVTTDVTVKSVLLKEVKQTKINTFEAIVAGKTADLKPASFTIVNKTTGQKVLVNTVSVDKVDATKVTFTTYVDLTNGNEIDVTLDSVTKTIKATDGQIASVAVDPVTIPVNTETKIEAVAKDATGVELKRFAYGTAYPSNFTFSITTTTGYVAGEKLCLPKAGDTATAKVEYSTGKYDANGKSEVITSGDVTIVAGEVAATKSKISLRYGKYYGKSFDDLKDNAVIAKNDTMYAAVKIINDKNEEVSNYSDYTLESANRNILLVSADALDGSKATITLNAVDEGTTTILVKDASGKTVETFPVTVKAVRAPAKLTVDHSDFSVVTGSSSTFGLNKKAVVFSLKDQYGDDIAINAGDLALTCTAAGSITSGIPADTKANAETATYVSLVGNKATFDAGATTVVGAYTYKVSLAGQHNENISTSFTAKIQDPAKLTGTATKRLVAIDPNGFETNRIDTVINAVNVATRENGLDIDIKFFTYKSGVATADNTTGVENSANGTAPNGSGLTVKATSSTAAAEVITSTGIIKFAAIFGDGTDASKAATGTYKIKVTDSGKDYETQFTVLDTQPKVTVKRVKESSELRDSAGDYAAVVNDAFEFYYEGAKYTAEANPVVTVNTNNIYVQKVNVKVTISDGTNEVKITVPVDVKQYIALK